MKGQVRCEALPSLLGSMPEVSRYLSELYGPSFPLEPSLQTGLEISISQVSFVPFWVRCGASYLPQMILGISSCFSFYNERRWSLGAPGLQHPNLATPTNGKISSVSQCLFINLKTQHTLPNLDYV